jgi:Na+-translocating ferredoxin:NAD+ oxidoreductase subunit D
MPLFGAFGGRWLGMGGEFLASRRRPVPALESRVISWQVPVAMLGTLALIGGALHAWEPDHFASPLQHALTGGAMLCAFFIATDPVSGCTTPRGRLYFGAGVALLLIVIRQWGAYPDGVAFAVLLMNCAAPWIDLHTRPRIYGEGPPR